MSPVADEDFSDLEALGIDGGYRDRLRAQESRRPRTRSEKQALVALATMTMTPRLPFTSRKSWVLAAKPQ